MTATGLSIREFARREGCSDTLVRRAVRDGKLKALQGGKLDPADIGTAWRPGNAKGEPGANTSANTTANTSANNANTAANTSANPADLTVCAEDDETLEQAAERLTPSLMTQFKTKADAEVVKETYLALLRKLEFDEKSGEVVRVAEVAKIVGSEYAKVRSKLMEIPSAVAPLAVLIKTPEEVRALIEEKIAHALEELAYDAPSGAAP
jgi:multidrug efflux pump subunit AcrB